MVCDRVIGWCKFSNTKVYYEIGDLCIFMLLSMIDREWTEDF
jgi:hypothetical protein